MRCARCAADAPTTARYCPQCGAALSDSLDALAAGEPASTGETGTTRFVRRSRQPDEPERDLWEGSYSPKAMAGVWLLLAWITLAALLIGTWQIRDARSWVALLAVLAVFWLSALMVLAYRIVGVRYRLTTQRLFHEKGVLRRTIDRIELVRMDDISCEQGLVERILGTGSIRIKSSDRSDPDFWIRGVEHVRKVSQEIDQARRAEQVRHGIYIGAG